MRNYSILTPFFYIFFLLFIFLHITFTTSTPPYIAVDNITLDCGSFGNSKATDERDWIGDIGSKYSPIKQNNKSNSSEAQRPVSNESIPYRTARFSYSQFTCVFLVTPGPKFVRLDFHSAAYSGFTKSKDFFTVKAGSFTLLRNFSSSIYTDSSDEKYFFKEFCINVEKNKKLKLTFIPFASGSMSYYAFINGIEVVSMPTDMYYTSSSSIIEGKVPVYVGRSPQFYINYSMALEMVYRLSIGGSSIPPMQDTGMFRKWSEGMTDYLLSNGTSPRDPSLKLKYSKIPKYIAPGTRDSMSNLTWGLPVETRFNYRVRLHFCEIDLGIHFSGTREFTIYIDYQLAEETADVILWADDNNTSYYKDYVVMIQNKGEDSHTLAIDLHPRTDATLSDAILNGVEVFKLGDLSGNLAGLNMVPPLMD
ncbi:receptor-like protein kinase FERONIA [Quercus lobata]|uniref:Malectin-like domain-containing protein n=1 Tax=Quercus lobata TaxID=97700 RepID=A0A7N2LJI7_QUELO|nr:receptor-like protein kinase FERONIA [Quercus lobata]